LLTRICRLIILFLFQVIRYTSTTFFFLTKTFYIFKINQRKNKIRIKSYLLPPKEPILFIQKKKKLNYFLIQDPKLLLVRSPKNNAISIGLNQHKYVMTHVISVLCWWLINKWNIHFSLSYHSAPNCCSYLFLITPILACFVGIHVSMKLFYLF